MLTSYVEYDDYNQEINIDIMLSKLQIFLKFASFHINDLFLVQDPVMDPTYKETKSSRSFFLVFMISTILKINVQLFYEKPFDLGLPVSSLIQSKWCSFGTNTSK